MIVRVSLSGHLTTDVARKGFGAVESELDAPGGPHDVIVDTLAVSGYDLSAREWFVQEWGPRLRPRIRRFAVLTTRISWRLMVAGIGLATRFDMKPFSTAAEAETWLARDPKRR